MSSEARGDGTSISVRGLAKRYEIYPRPFDRLKQALWRGRKQFYHEFWALREVSFDVRPGEAVAVIGRNGSGKSTLLQIIAGTLAPTLGEVRTVGQVGALLELGSGFSGEFTGRESVYLAGAILGLEKREIDRRFEGIAEFADIGEFIDQPVKTYSTGMVLRLAFATQAQVDPEILIVDEALAVGDERFQRKCYARLDQLRAKGTSILLVTHSMAAVERYCERAVLLDAGRVHGIGPSKEIVEQYHALLYGADVAEQEPPEDEEVVESPSPAVQEELLAVGDDATDPSDRSATVPSGPAAALLPKPGSRAWIDQVWIRDAAGRDRDLFDSGEEVEVGFSVVTGERISVLQGGLRIRTVEGVEAFGTSTGYVNKSLTEVPAGSKCVFRARLRLSLCTDTYFLSVAAAEALSRTEMLYLDRRTDAIMFQVRQQPLRCTGIAALKARIHFHIASRQQRVTQGMPGAFRAKEGQA